MTVLAIDPGSERSAWVLWDGERVRMHAKHENEMFLADVANGTYLRLGAGCDVVIEQIASYGMTVGAHIFETCVWTGRFWQAADRYHVVHRLPRKDVKLHLCGQARAKDANIRQALIDRFGGQEKAIGKKAAPGPLYGLKADEWQALALAVTWWDLHGNT